jgi:hypothetical protein
MTSSGLLGAVAGSVFVDPSVAQVWVAGKAGCRVGPIKDAVVGRHVGTNDGPSVGHTMGRSLRASRCTRLVRTDVG